MSLVLNIYDFLVQSTAKLRKITVYPFQFIAIFSLYQSHFVHGYFTCICVSKLVSERLYKFMNSWNLDRVNVYVVEYSFLNRQWHFNVDHRLNFVVIVDRINMTDDIIVKIYFINI